MLRPVAPIPRGWIVLITSFVLLMALTASGRAFNSPEERATLKGVQAVSVVVEILSPDIERDGLTKSQLKADVELRLQSAGIGLMPTSMEYLYLTLLAVKTKEGLYAYSLLLELNQPLFLMRDSRIVTTATWKMSGLSMVHQRNLSETLRGQVANLVDVFIKAYFEQNRRQ